jgi:adenine-specific DNA-methyltransferase
MNYDDNLEHSIWLGLMYARLKLLKSLLAEDGVIFVQLNDEEMNYCKVMLDEIFGRSNFINIISLFTKVSAGASPVVAKTDD